MKNSVISSSPEVMGGTPVFSGTRIPVETFIEYLEGGESIDDFLEGFPSVTREKRWSPSSRRRRRGLAVAP